MEIMVDALTSACAANAPKGMINVVSLNSIKLKQKPEIC